jgi:hypothetical protein
MIADESCGVTFVKQTGGIIYCEREKGHKGMHKRHTVDDCIFSWMPKKVKQ